MKRISATIKTDSAVQPPTPNRTELQLKQLRPYVSVILYDLRAWWDHSEDLVDEVEASIEATISSTHKQGDRLKDYGPIAKLPSIDGSPPGAGTLFKPFRHGWQK